MGFKVVSMAPRCKVKYIPVLTLRTAYMFSVYGVLCHTLSKAYAKTFLVLKCIIMQNGDCAHLVLCDRFEVESFYYF